MRTTRRTTLLATAVIASVALAGCGGSDDKASGGSDGGPVTLSIATFNEFGYEDLLKEYQKLNPNVTIKHVKGTTDANKAKLRSALGANSGASDIEAIEVDWVSEFIQYPDKFADLKSPDVEGRWLDWKTKAVTAKDGKLIGYGTDIGPEAICYRSDLFAKAGLPTDREAVGKLLEGGWDKYFEVGKQFTSKANIPWYDSAGSIWQAMINQEEQSYETPDGKIIAKENPRLKEIYDQVMKASIDDKLSARLNQWTPDWTSSFQDSAFATMLCPSWMLGVIEGNAKGVKGWDVAPVFPGGGGNWGGSYLTVPAQGKHVEEAKKLADWLTAPEQQIKAFVAKGPFPSQVKALTSDELLKTKNAFFNEAPTGSIFADRAKAVTVTPFKGPKYAEINTLFTDAIARVDVDKTDDAAGSWAKLQSALGSM